MNTRANNLTPGRVAGYRGAQQDIALYGHDLVTAMLFSDRVSLPNDEAEEGYKAALADHIAQLDDDDDEPYWPDHDHAEDR